LKGAGSRLLRLLPAGLLSVLQSPLATLAESLRWTCAAVAADAVLAAAATTAAVATAVLLFLLLPKLLLLLDWWLLCLWACSCVCLPQGVFRMCPLHLSPSRHKQLKERAVPWISGERGWRRPGF
jgi:hypothetical protein